MRGKAVNLTLETGHRPLGSACPVRADRERLPSSRKMAQFANPTALPAGRYWSATRPAAFSITPSHRFRRTRSAVNALRACRSEMILSIAARQVANILFTSVHLINEFDMLLRGLTIILENMKWRRRRRASAKSIRRTM